MIELRVAEAARDDLRQDVAVIDRHLQILLLIELRRESPGQMLITWPPTTDPPIKNITLPWPWSVPWLPFSAALRPNSDITTR